MKKELKKVSANSEDNEGNIFPTDKDGNIIEGNYETPVGEVRINKAERAKHYDVISMARAMNKDFAKKTKELFDPEVQAVHEAIASGIYVSFRPAGTQYDQQDCLRVNSNGRCFCSHLRMDHNPFSGTSRNTKCTQENCKCRRFSFAPGRPEDFGEFWLTKRRDFVREAYRMKCRCKHTHVEHDSYPSPHRCKVHGCSCGGFSSASVCAACDQHWEEHDTVFELEAERKRAGRQIREDWYPFSELPAMRDIALTGEDNPDIEQLADAIPPTSRGGRQDNSTLYRPGGQ